MRALAVAPARREIEVVERPEPEPAAGEVVLRTLEVGVCGTDREIAAFEYGTPPAGDEQLVIGHEALAEVVDASGDGGRFEPGQLAVPMVRRPCSEPQCLPCRSGRADFCRTGRYLERGIKGAHGFMSDVFVEQPDYLVPVPADLRHVAVLVEPLTIAEKGLTEAARVRGRLPAGEEGAGTRAVALGAGPVGLLGAMKLRADGFDTWVYSREPAPNPKADLANAIGARYVSTEEATPAELASEMGGIDLVYEAVGVSAPVFEMVHALGPNAVFVLTGVPGPSGERPVDTDRLMRNLVLGNQVLLGTVNAPREAFEAAIADLRRFNELWPEALEALISERHPLEAAPGLLRERTGGIKHVVAVSG